jgi:acid stress-induced BolA-like protein IbaG/YrbA
MSSSVTPAQLQALVERALPDARVEVHLYSGDDHFEMVVISESFAGKPRVRRHQMVYAALGDHMREAVHALALKTLTPEEAA